MSRVSSRTNKGVHTHGGDPTMYYGTGDKRESVNHEKEGQQQVKKPKLLSSEPPPAVEEGDVRCTPCGATKENYDELTDKGGIMIECEVCGTWQHASCMGYKTKKAIPSVYKCNICDPEMANKLTLLTTEKALKGDIGGKDGSLKNGSLKDLKDSQTKKEVITKPISKSDLKSTSSSSKTVSKSNSKSTSKPITKVAPPPDPIPVIQTIDQHLKDKTRVSVAKAFYNVFKRHFPNDYKFPEGSNAETQAVKFALQLEHEILEFSSPKDKKYTEKSRSLVVLVKKPNVMSRIMNGTLKFKAIVTSSPEEIDEDLKKYAEKVRQELIRRSVLTVEDESLQRVRRTHKGEEVVEDSASHGGDSYSEVNIETRSVDHRRFNLEDRVADNKIIVSEQNSTQVFDDDDDDDDDVNVDGDGGVDVDIVNVNAVDGVKKHENLAGEGKEGLYSHSQSGSQQDDGIPDLEDDELDFILRDDKKAKTGGSYGPRVSKEPYGSKIIQESSTSGLNNSKVTSQSSALPSRLPSNVWDGDIVFPDFVLFSGDVTYLGCANSLANVDKANGILQYNRQIKITKEIFGLKKYEIEGRLDRRKADPYLQQTMVSRDLYVVEVNGIGHDFDKLRGYLRDHKKAGVLSGKPPFVKDAYLISGNIPGFLAPLKLNLGSVYGVFVVKKDYNPMAKSILKKTEPTVQYRVPEKPNSTSMYQQRPPSIPRKPEVNPLSSILSKLQ